MSYSTRAEVRDMVKDDALNAIIGDTFIEDPVEREELVSPIIDAAIADADAEIDGYLAKRYAVPLAPAPRVINKFSKDIAVYNLFSRIGIDEGTDQKTYLNRYNAAIKFLTLVAEGTGVSIHSALAVQEAVAAGQLLQFELDETPVRRSIYMARRRKSSMSSPARTFAELVQHGGYFSAMYKLAH